MDDDASPQGGRDAKGPAHAASLGPPVAVWHSPRRLSHERRVPSDELRQATYAALDLGTNNCRLLIARPTADGFRVVDAFSRIIRLGEGRRRVPPHQRGGDRARGRGAPGLPRQDARTRVMRARLIATAACRAAENGEEFRSRVAEEAGLELEIIDSATEARLAATGCTELFDPTASGVILFDIGGGSSELVRLNRPRETAGAARRRPISSAGPRCRSASSRSPSVTAAKSCRAIPTMPW